MSGLLCDLLSVPTMQEMQIAVSKVVKRRLTADEQRMFMLFVKKSAGHPKYACATSAVAIKNGIATDFAQLLIQKYSGSNIDIKEMQKAELIDADALSRIAANTINSDSAYYGSSSSGSSGSSGSSAPSAPGSAYGSSGSIHDAFLFFSTRYRLIDSDPLFQFKFAFNNSSNVQTGTVTSISNEIKDLVEIEIYEFYLPYVEDADDFADRISLEIQELNSQSYVSPANTRHHFDFRPEIDGSRIKLCPLTKTFRFSKPITQLQNMTLIFKNPINTITFNDDRQVVSLAAPLFTTITLAGQTIDSAQTDLSGGPPGVSSFVSSGLPGLDGAYDGWWIIMTSGAATGEIHQIRRWTKTTLPLDTAVLYDNWTAIPALGDTFDMYQYANYGNPATFTTTLPHNMISGDKIWFDQFGLTSTVPSSSSGFSALDTQINQQNGHRITKIDNFTFSVQSLNFSNAQFLPGIAPTAIFQSKVMQFGMRVGYLG